MDPFVVRALAAGIGLAIIAAPLGCIVVWRRMAYFGETLAQGSLLGVALGLALNINLNLSVILTAIAVAAIVIMAGRQKLVALDSVLGLMHHAALASGVLALALLGGPSVDLMGFLFGDIFAVTESDLIWIFGGGAIVLGLTALLWRPLVRLSLNEELAAAEGVKSAQTRAGFDILLAITIAMAMKIVGILLVMAFLIVPAVAARPVSSTPERMAILAGLIAASGAIGGILLSLNYDLPGGPSIVLALTLLAALTMSAARLIRR